MNGIDRNLVAQAIIVLAVTVGGWMMLVQPLRKEIAGLETVIEQRRADASPTNHGSNAAAVERLTNAQEHLADIRARNTVAADSSQLYGLIMDLAAEHGIEVMRLQPGGDRQRSETETVHANSIEMTLEGDFAKTSEFVEAVTEIRGFMRPTTLQVSPTERDGRNLVQVQFHCEALQFTLGEVIAQTEGSGDAQQ